MDGFFIFGEYQKKDGLLALTSGLFKGKVSIATLRQSIQQALRHNHSEEEIMPVTNWLLEHRLGISATQLRMQNDLEAPEGLLLQIQQDLQKLQSGMPIQYVLGVAPFLDFNLHVAPGVLIPRPETEEIADNIIKYYRKHQQVPSTILDVGTGSGCLAIAMQRAFPKAKVLGIDLEAPALEVARINIEKLAPSVQLLQIDFLDAAQTTTLPFADLIVSNPPYIPQIEAADMAPRVLEHEPLSALFVPNEDPLIFYRTLLEFSKTHLVPGGHLWCETAASQKASMHNLLAKYPIYQFEIGHDLQEKFRFVHILKPFV
jgi:release factor glutamine methyltransferase